MDFQDSPIRTDLSVSCVEFVNHIYLSTGCIFLGKMGVKSLLKKNKIKIYFAFKMEFFLIQLRWFG